MTDSCENDSEAWVDRHGDALYRYAYLRLGSQEAVADIVQETFLHALRAKGGFAGRSSERTWLIGILRHKILDHYRRSRTSKVSDDDANPVASEYDGRGHWRNLPKSWGNDPSDSLEAEEFWGIFHSCLAKLPKSLADAFFLREVDGLDAEAVQRELGVTAANLWTRLHRARTLLRRCLETHWFDSPKPEASDIRSEIPSPSLPKGRLKS